jgi:hypothetical protein
MLKDWYRLFLFCYFFNDFECILVFGFCGFFSDNNFILILVFGCTCMFQTKMRLADHTLMFDEESRPFRWFLLPSEAAQLLNIDKPASFTVRSVSDLPFCPQQLRTRLEKKAKVLPDAFSGRTPADKLESREIVECGGDMCTDFVQDSDQREKVLCCDRFSQQLQNAMERGYDSDALTSCAHCDRDPDLELEVKQHTGDVSCSVVKRTDKTGSVGNGNVVEKSDDENIRACRPNYAPSAMEETKESDESSSAFSASSAVECDVRIDLLSLSSLVKTSEEVCREGRNSSGVAEISQSEKGIQNNSLASGAKKKTKRSGGSGASGANSERQSTEKQNGKSSKKTELPGLRWVPPAKDIFKPAVKVRTFRVLVCMSVCLIEDDRLCLCITVYYLCVVTTLLLE